MPGRQGSIVKRAPAPPPPPQKGAPPVPPMWTGTAPLRTWTFFAEDSLKRYSTDCRSRNNFWKMNNNLVRCNQRERVKCLWSEICQVGREAGLGRLWDPVADVASFVAPFARAVFTSLASAASADSYIFRAPSLPAPSFVRGDKVLGAKSCFSGNLRAAPGSECFSTDVKFSSFGGSWVCSFFSKVVSKLSVLSTSS